MPDRAYIWIMRRSNLLHPDFLQHSRRAISFDERMPVNPLDLRMGKRIINETLGRFRRQTATSVGRNNRVAYFNYASKLRKRLSALASNVAQSAFEEGQ
jgi:hypothetical protein